MFDIDARLDKVLRKLHGKHADIHCGEPDGDFTTVDVNDLEPADGLIAGPPCAPWSSVGPRKGTDDPRSCVFDHVLEAVCMLAHKGLLFFILENVPGILRPRSGEVYMDVVKRTLRQHARMMKVSVHEDNTLHRGLPQSRPRVLIVGVRRNILRKTGVSKIPPPVPAWKPAPLKDFLSIRKPASLQEDMTKNQWDNLECYKDKLHDKMQPGQPQIVACLDVGRSPFNHFGTWWKADDTVHALRGANTSMFVLSMGQGDRPGGMDFHRFLDADERVAIAGFDLPDLMPYLTKTALVKAIGNAYSPALIAAHLAPVLKLIGKSGVVPSQPRVPHITIPVPCYYNPLQFLRMESGLWPSAVVGHGGSAPDPVVVGHGGSAPDRVVVLTPTLCEGATVDGSASTSAADEHASGNSRNSKRQRRF